MGENLPSCQEMHETSVHAYIKRFVFETRRLTSDAFSAVKTAVRFSRFRRKTILHNFRNRIDLKKNTYTYYMIPQIS